MFLSANIAASRGGHEGVRSMGAGFLAECRVSRKKLRALLAGDLLMSTVKTYAIALIAGLNLAAPAFAQVPLSQEKHINDSLRAGRIGDVIRKTCPSVDARMFTVWSKVEDLKKYALTKGYTRTEVEAFIKDPKEKARLKAEADVYLKKAGAVAGNVESYCKVGRDEIAKKSLIGSLLRSRL